MTSGNVYGQMKSLDRQSREKIERQLVNLKIELENWVKIVKN